MNAHKMGTSDYLEGERGKEVTTNNQSTSEYFLFIGSRDRANTRQILKERGKKKKEDEEDKELITNDGINL